MASNQLQLDRGNTLIIDYINQTNATPAAPVSLDGSTIYFTAKPSPGYSNNTTDSDATWQIISTGNLENTCTLTVTPQDSWVAPGTYYWDITIDYQSDMVNVITTMAGTIRITGVPTNKASQ